MKKLNINFQKMMKLKGTSLVLVGTLLASSLTGCSSNDKCDISFKHAHMYVNEDGYVRYIESEKNEVKGCLRSYKYEEIDEEESKLYKFLNSKGLFRIDENLDLVLAQQEANKDFNIYEYSYLFFIKAFPYTGYSWTNDPNRTDLTGEIKECHYVYQAYNIVVDERGKYVLVPSEKVTDLTTVMEDYPYIKIEYYKAVDKDGIEVSYDDDVPEVTVSAPNISGNSCGCDCGCECSNTLRKTNK